MFKNFLIFIFLGISAIYFSQKNTSQLAQKELNDKIEKYKYIDTLSTKDYSRYSIRIKEGSIQMNDKQGEVTGTGGFSTYTYKTDTENPKLLKSVHHSIIHFEKLKNQMQNSEKILITIFYNAEGKPDLAKVIEDHYTLDEVLLSSLNYISLPKSIEEAKKITYTKPYLKELIVNIFEEAK